MTYLLGVVIAITGIVVFLFGGPPGWILGLFLLFIAGGMVNQDESRSDAYSHCDYPPSTHHSPSSSLADDYLADDYSSDDYPSDETWRDQSWLDASEYDPYSSDEPSSDDYWLDDD